MVLYFDLHDNRAKLIGTFALIFFKSRESLAGRTS